MKRKINQIKAGVILGYTSTAINILFSVFYTPIMLRLLGQSEHGLISVCSTAISWITLVSLGLNGSYIRYFAKYKASNDEEKMAKLNGFFVMFFAIVGVIAFAFGLVIAFNLRLVFGTGLDQAQYNTATILCLIIALDMAMAFPASVFSSILDSREKFFQCCCINIFQNVCTPLLSLALLLLGKGSIGLVAATTTIDFVAYAIKAFYCFKVEKVKFVFKIPEKGLLKDAFSFSIATTIESIIGRLAGTIDQTLITRYMSTAAVSIYAIGYSFYNYFNAFSNPISSVFGPRIFVMTEKYINDKKLLSQKITEIFVRVGRIKIYFLMLMFSGFVFFGKEFILFWAGPGYYNSYIVAILLLGSGIFPLAQILGFVIQRARNKHRIRVFVYTGMNILNIGLTIWLCPIYGEIGATIATAISLIVSDVLVMNIIYRIRLQLKVEKFWIEVFGIIIRLTPAFILGTLIKIFVPIDTLYFMIIFAVIYAAVYCLDAWFLCCNPYEKELFGGKVKSILAKFKKKKAVASATASDETADVLGIEEEDNTQIEEE